MYRWQGLADVPLDWGRSVVTIGVFDGVHRGQAPLVPQAGERERHAAVDRVAERHARAALAGAAPARRRR